MTVTTDSATTALATALGSVNWLAVALATLAYTVLGGLWFTVLFGRQYAAALGRRPSTDKPGALFIAGPAVCTLVVTLTTALLLGALAVDTLGGAVLVALVVGVGYLVANTVNIAINPNMPRPLYYGAITGSYHLVGIVVAGLVLGAF